MWALATAPAAAFEPPSPFLSRPPVGERSADLPQGEGRDLVATICAACHSLRMVTQQRLSRQRWDELIDWMVAEQGMAELDADTRRTVLDYLATHLGVDDAPSPGAKAEKRG